MATKLRIVEPNTCGPSISRWLVDFWKICADLLVDVKEDYGWARSRHKSFGEDMKLLSLRSLGRPARVLVTLDLKQTVRKLVQYLLANE